LDTQAPRIVWHTFEHLPCTLQDLGLVEEWSNDANDTRVNILHQPCIYRRQPVLLTISWVNGYVIVSNNVLAHLTYDLYTQYGTVQFIHQLLGYHAPDEEDATDPV
jgi:hypothetical protein